jgi:hypothetical protein
MLWKKFILVAPIAMLLIATPAESTSIVSVTLEKLFQEADLVAYVTITSGDSECHDVTVYRSKVLVPFKGCVRDQAFYFGPYTTYGIGKEYVVFLRSVGKTVEQLPQGKGDGGCFTLEPAGEPYFEVMYAGYSVLDVEYSIEMDKPDYAVRVVGAQVILPKDLKSYPLTYKYAGARDERWVHKDDLLSYLKKVADKINAK